MWRMRFSWWWRDPGLKITDFRFYVSSIIKCNTCIIASRFFNSSDIEIIIHWTYWTNRSESRLLIYLFLSTKAFSKINTFRIHFVFCMSLLTRLMNVSLRLHRSQMIKCKSWATGLSSIVRTDGRLRKSRISKLIILTILSGVLSTPIDGNHRDTAWDNVKIRSEQKLRVENWYLSCFSWIPSILLNE